MKNEKLQEQGIAIVNILYSIFVSKYKLFTYMSKEDLEDLKQDTMVEMLERLNKFDPDKNLQLSTFLSPRINGFLLDQLRKRGRLKLAETKYILELINLQTDQILALDKEQVIKELKKLHISNDNIKEFLFDIIDDEMYEILDSLYSLSNTRIYILLSHYIMDKSIKQITDELGYDYSGGWVYRMKREALSYLRNSLINKGLLPKEVL